MKWFNFSSQGAKLERIEAGSGQYSLKLTLPAGVHSSVEATNDLIERHGWVEHEVSTPSETISYINHSLVHSARDVASTLRPFFSDHQIRSAFSDIDALAQGEEVLGLLDRANATVDDFENEMHDVSSENIARIRASILRSQTEVARLSAINSSQPMNGRGLEFVLRMGKLDSAELGVSAVLEAVRDTQPALNELISNFDPSDTDLNTKVGALVHRDRVDAVYNYVISRARQHEIITGFQPDRTFSALRYIRQRAPILSMEPLNVGEIQESLRTIGMTIRSDKSLSRNQYAHALESTRRAFMAVGRLLNSSPHDFLPNQTNVILRISRKSTTSDADVMGQHARIGDADGANGVVQNVAISAEQGGSIIHEIGHAIHDAYGITDDEIRQVISNSGVRERVVQAVQYDLQNGTLDPDDAEYYLLDKEIWARSFEATLVNRSVASGDIHLFSIGGLTAAHPSDIYSPTGNKVLTENFAHEISTLINQKRSVLQKDRNLHFEP